MNTIHGRGWGLLAAMVLIVWLIPSQSQTAPGSPACQGSTIDLQGEEVAEKSRAFLAKLQSAVSKDDKAEVASMVSYPLLVIHANKKAHIRTEAQFVSRYESIFDEHVRSAIAKQSSQCLFGNYQGTMIGGGEIWYREQPNGKMKVVTVNPTAGRQ